MMDSTEWKLSCQSVFGRHCSAIFIFHSWPFLIKDSECFNLLSSESPGSLPSSHNLLLSHRSIHLTWWSVFVSHPRRTDQPHTLSSPRKWFKGVQINPNAMTKIREMLFHHHRENDAERLEYRYLCNLLCREKNSPKIKAFMIFWLVLHGKMFSPLSAKKDNKAACCFMSFTYILKWLSGQHTLCNGIPKERQGE